MIEAAVGETLGWVRLACLTTEPKKLVGTCRPKAMRVILTTPEAIGMWMTAPPPEALQRPLPVGALMVVARGEKKDEGGIAGIETVKVRSRPHGRCRTAYVLTGETPPL